MQKEVQGVGSGLMEINESEKEARIAFACKKKLRFTMEEAAEKVGNRPRDVIPYLCSNCQYVHFGHKPYWELTPDELLEKRRAKEAAERRIKRIAQANDLSRFLARTQGQRANQPGGQEYPGRGCV
jgi:hypothetical protein